VLIRDPAQRFDPQALLCTDLTQSHLSIVSCFLRRWQVEVTFQEVRTHLGVETQRQWANRAIARTTPCLLALLSVVTLLADRLVNQGTLPLPRDAWYAKQRPTFARCFSRCAPTILGTHGFSPLWSKTPHPQILQSFT
ncbi:MAG TPA: hypothetical protein VK638_46620, partial [Edaphobacter sp.]|nr:hypothetical protein [Edaphobacter sp.]